MSLKVWLPLTGNLENLGLSNYAMSIFRGSETYSANGKIGKCFNAAGTNALKIENIISDFYNYTAYSLSVWFCVDAQNTSHTGSGIISAGNWNNQVINLALSGWSTDHYTQLRCSGTTWNKTVYSYNFYKSTWYHVVVSSDGTKTYAYVNGTLIGDTGAGFLPSSVEGNNICIGGATYYAGMQFFGRINDVRIYDHKLSVKEIKELAKGLVMHYKLDGSGLGGENVVRNSTGFEGSTTWNGLVTVGAEGGAPYLIAQRTNTASTSRTFCYVKNGITSLVSGWAAGSSFTISGYYKIPTDAQITVTSYIANMFIRWTLPSGSSDTGFYVGVTEARGVWTWFEKTFTVPSTYAGGASNFYLSAFAQGLSTIYWKNVKMELGPHATAWSPAKADADYPAALGSGAQDCSGYGYNGIANNIVCTGDTPRYSAASVFNGSNSYAKCESVDWMVQGEDALTVNIWVKAALWPTDTRFFSTIQSGGFSAGQAGSSGYYRLRTYRYTNAALTSTADLAWNTALKISDLPTDAWCMLTFVYSLTGLSTYINGVLHGTYAATSYGLYHNTDCRLFIGCEANTASPTTPYFNGQMSDFRLYYTALSAEDILELYQTSASVDKSGNVYARELVEV